MRRLEAQKESPAPLVRPMSRLQVALNVYYRCKLI